MTTIWYDNIEDILLNITDPNTWWAISEVPWVSAPKINAGVSVYNVEWWSWTWIAWWSTNVSWSSSDYDTVDWSGWNIYLPDWTALTVNSWNTGNMSSTTYIYYDRDTSSVSTTTSASASVGENKILLCVASPTTSWKKAEFQAFGTDDQSTFIYASNIASNTITANEIASNTITAAEIQSWAITTSKIDAWAVTAGKIDVTQLSDIDPDLWTITAGTLKWVTVIAGNVDSWAWMKLYPYSSSQWRLEFYYNWNVVWSMRWANLSNAWDCVYIVWWTSWSWYIALAWNVMCLEKLRIPVWTDLY